MNDAMEHSIGDLNSPMIKKKRKYNNNDVIQFMLRVFNSSLIFSTLTLPFFLQMFGLIMGSLTFTFFFILSYIESLLLKDLKYFAKQKKKQGTLASIFKLFHIEKSTITIYRILMLLNAYLYIVLLLVVYQQSIHCLIYRTIDESEINKNQWVRVLSSQQFIQLIGSIPLIIFLIKWRMPDYVIASARLLGVISIIFIIIATYSVKNETTSEASDILYPSSETIVQSFISAPTILLAFAYHSQFFTGMLSLIEIENDESQKKVNLGTLYGSLLMMILELTLGVLGAIALQNATSVPEYISGNIIIMVYKLDYKQIYFYYVFYIMLSLSAYLQITQYIPYAAQLVETFFSVDQDDKSQPKDIEFMQITENETSRQKSTNSKTSQSLRKQLNQSLSNNIPQAKDKSIIITLCVYLFAFLFAMGAPPILLISCLMGGITQNFVTFVIPSNLYLNNHYKNDSELYKKGFAWFTLIFSACFSCISVYFGLYGLWTGEI